MRAAVVNFALRALMFSVSRQSQKKERKVWYTTEDRDRHDSLSRCTNLAAAVEMWNSLGLHDDQCWFISR
jgi:hypothetical protein